MDKRTHWHLCRDCGTRLYLYDFVSKNENGDDYRIGGRCPECQKKMGRFKAFEYADSYGCSITDAEFDVDRRYRKDAAPYMMIGMGNTIDLPDITWREVFTFFDGRDIDGQFNGCTNRAWIITAEEEAQLLEIDRANGAEKKLVEKVKELQAACEAKIGAERQEDFPSREEAKRRMIAYNNINNEGGYGFVPHVYCKEEYEEICRVLYENKHCLVSIRRETDSDEVLTISIHGIRNTYICSYSFGKYNPYWPRTDIVHIPLPLGEYKISQGQSHVFTEFCKLSVTEVGKKEVVIPK